MTFQTIPAKFTPKHLDKISNLRCFSLDNSFSGKPVENHQDAIEFAINKMDGRLQVNKTTGEGRIRLHSNLWYEFDYQA